MGAHERWEDLSDADRLFLRLLRLRNDPASLRFLDLAAQLRERELAAVSGQLGLLEAARGAPWGAIAELRQRSGAIAALHTSELALRDALLTVLAGRPVRAGLEAAIAAAVA